MGGSRRVGFGPREGPLNIRFNWNTLPPDLLEQLDAPLRGHDIWPSHAYTRIRCDFLCFGKWPKVTIVRYHPVGGAQQVVEHEELPQLIDDIKAQVITRRLLGEEF